MKRTICLLMAVLMLLSLTVTVLADGTTTLTTTVPTATYTLNIPADQQVDFGAVETTLNAPTVTGASGFAEGKNLQVTVSFTDFICSAKSTSIPISLFIRDEAGGAVEKEIKSGDSLVFLGLQTGATNEYVAYPAGAVTLKLDTLFVRTTSSDWGKALGGDYTATITFTSEVVVDDT